MTTDTLIRERNDVWALIGRTPLVRLRSFEPRAGVEIYAKLESRNPGGSVKDRAALAMIHDGERAGALGAGRILLDATSGNTGIAYAMLGAARAATACGCACRPTSRPSASGCCAPTARTSCSPIRWTAATAPSAKRGGSTPPSRGRYFYPDQYSNDANWRAHFDTTGAEILEQTGGRGDPLRRRPRHERHVRRHRPPAPRSSIAVDPARLGAAGLAAARHSKGSSTWRRRSCPAIYDPSLADRTLDVADRRRASTDAPAGARGRAVRRPVERRRARGVPSRSPRRSIAGVIVTVFPDGGDRYLVESFWEADADEPAPGANRRSRSGADARRHPRATASGRIRTSAAARCSARARGEVAEAFALSNTHGSASAGGGFSSAPTTTAGRGARRRSAAASSSASTTRIRITRRSRRRSTSSTRGRT